MDGTLILLDYSNGASVQIYNYCTFSYGS